MPPDATQASPAAGPPGLGDDEPEVERIRAVLEARLLGGAVEPTRLGRFVVVGRIGAGGMGVVYAAYDPELDRKVAIKLLHTELERAGVRERIVREGKAMARLSHPNVTMVHEIGEHRGRAFVAMEFVRGQTLREWVRAAAQSWRAVVAAYVQAGRGLAAAHAVGLVHRDFKPDNAMIEIDAAGAVRVRVMDFGLARFDALADSAATTLDDTSAADDGLATPMTRQGVRIGTPGYMAPEQIHGCTADARTDQFAFCVALWEALIGARPFPGRNVTEVFASVDAETISPPPRGRMPRFVELALRRGLRADGAARHPTMDALLAALLDDPATRRRRRAATIGLASVIALAGGGGWLHREAQRAQCEAEGAAIAEVWNAEAERELAEAMRASGLAFAESTVERALPRLAEYAAAWQSLRTESCLQDASTSEPELTAARNICFATARETFAELVTTLGLAELEGMQRAITAVGGLPRLETCRDEPKRSALDPLSADPAEVAAARELQSEVGRIRVALVLGHYAGQVARAERALAEAEALRRPRAVAAARTVLAIAAMRDGDEDRAEVEFDAAFHQAARVGADALAAESAVQLVFLIGYRRARYDDARRWVRLGEVMLDRADAGAVARADLLGNEGLLALHEGRAAEAAVAFERTLALVEGELGRDHPDLGPRLNNLGEAQRRLGDLEAARSAYERSIALTERSLGADHPFLAHPIHGLAECAASAGDLEGALQLHRREYELRERTLGADHPGTRISAAAVARAMEQLGRTGEAIAIVQGAVDRADRDPGANSFDRAWLLNELTRYQESVGALDDARRSGLRSLALYEAVLGPTHRDLVSVLVNLGNVERAAHRPAAAREQFSRAVTLAEREPGRPHESLTFALIGLGWTHVDEGRPHLGLPLLERALAVREETLPIDHPLVANAYGHLADAEQRSRRLARAAEHAGQALAIQRRTLPPGHPEIAFALTMLARVHRDLRRYEDARIELEEALEIAVAAQAAGNMTATWLADVRFALATVLRAQDREPARVLELARAAAHAFRTAGQPFAGANAEVDAFLRGS